MSHNHYTPKRRAMSMAELNHNKTLNLRLEAHLRSLATETGDNLYAAQADRVHYCSTFWQGQYCPKCGKYHNMHTTGCKHRLCPICATRFARVTAMQALEAIDLIAQDSPDIELELLTLTQRNVEGDDLCNEINKLLQAWAYLCNRPHMRGSIIGWARTIEIVPSIDLDGTYHPHIHAIMIHRATKKAPTLQWYIDAWRSGLHLDYDPVCDLRPIDNASSAVFEVSKYISKMSRVYDGSALEHDHVRYMTKAIYNRRLRSYGGVWRKARIRLGQMQAEAMDDDALSEYGDITDLTAKCPSCSAKMIDTTLRWAGLHYVTMPDQIAVIPMPQSYKEFLQT